MQKIIYDINNEYINIDNYSPFSHINEVSEQYKYNPFKLPFIKMKKGLFTPVHPDTFQDLKLNKKDIAFKKEVYPTSSFRAVYSKEQNLFYKLPLLRKITRGIRGLSQEDMKRSEAGGENLSKIDIPGFFFLKETSVYGINENFNFIIRELPENVELFPWFYVIASQKFNSKFQIKCMENIIKIWLNLASKDLYLEAHTQNILVTPEGDIYYRDLSDVRSFHKQELQPSYIKNRQITNISDILSVTFDRAVCSQNLQHLFNYNHSFDLNTEKYFKQFINEQIELNKLSFPDYSMGFSTIQTDRIPQKMLLNKWRSN